jgi:lysozyme family protein
MRNNFAEALQALLKHEGGYVNHPSDPGGMTNLGVTK